MHPGARLAARSRRCQRYIAIAFLVAVQQDAHSPDFPRPQGQVQGAKDKGKMRAEGKEYVVQDGDVFLFRFNV